MKNLLKLVIIFLFISLLSACAETTTGASFGIEGTNANYLRSSINETCQTFVNYIGDDIYGNPVSDGTFGEYWQIGAHPANATNEVPDVGINIFVADLVTGNYLVSDNFEPGKALVYYTDQNGNEFDSTANNTGSINVMNISSGSISKLEITFNNVEVYNSDLDMTFCINNFTYGFVVR